MNFELGTRSFDEVAVVRMYHSVVGISSSAQGMTPPRLNMLKMKLVLICRNTDELAKMVYVVSVHICRIIMRLAKLKKISQMAPWN